MILTYTSSAFDKNKKDQWLAILNRQLQWPVSMELKTKQPFDAMITRFDFGGLTVISHRLSPAVIERGAMKEGGGAPNFSLNLVTSGGMVLLHHGRRNVLRSGDIVLADPFEPSRLVLEEATAIITVCIPADLLQAHMPEPQRLCNLVLSPAHNFSEVLCVALHSLLDMGRKELSELTQEMSVAPFLGLLAFAFLANYGTHLQGDSGARCRLAQIRQYIDCNLSDETLGPETIASRFSLSPRYVRKLFAMDGDSVTRYIQRRRLETSASKIADPLWRERSITDICFRCGFNSAAHFTRAFKSLFGITPGEFRKRAIPL